MLPDFIFYTFSLVWSWLGLLAGSLGTVIALYERHKKQLSVKPYVAILISFLLFAGFGAWREERSQVTLLTKQAAELNAALQRETQKHTPDIRVTVEEAFAGIVLDGSPNDTSLVFYLAVKNLGQMPSIVDGYAIALKLPGGVTVLPEKVPLTKPFTLRSPSGQTVKIDRSYAIYEKTLRPIPSGGMEKGIFVLIVRIPVIVSSDSGAKVSMIPAQREQRYGSS